MPTLNQSAALDVVVFIHGGAFMFGSGHSYGEKFIMDRDVVFVNFNYRLGPFGKWLWLRVIILYTQEVN